MAPCWRTRRWATVHPTAAPRGQSKSSAAWCAPSSSLWRKGRVVIRSRSVTQSCHGSRSTPQPRSRGTRSEVTAGRATRTSRVTSAATHLPSSASAYSSGRPRPIPRPRIKTRLPRYSSTAYGWAPTSRRVRILWLPAQGSTTPGRSIDDHRVSDGAAPDWTPSRDARRSLCQVRRATSQALFGQSSEEENVRKPPQPTCR